MTNFAIKFENPWLLLLLIPAVALAFFLFFRMSKKYRRTRNRIVSLVLYLIVIFLSVNVLSGITFAYETPNHTNEVMLVVDISYSNRQSEDKKNEFIQSVINESDSAFQIGIVTFAVEPAYTVKLGTDTGTVYQEYLKALPPENRKDDSGTNIAAALLFAKEQFKNPKTAKIVLISDGIETDDSALSAITTIVTDGIKIDTAFFPDNYGKEAQVIAIEPPDYSVAVNTSAKVGVTIQSSYSGVVSITLYDNGTADAPVSKPMINGVERFQLDHTFTSAGVHELCVKITSEGDTLAQNNTFYSYFFLESFDKILIVDKSQDFLESSKLAGLTTDENYDVTVVSVDGVPDNIDDLIEYHQIILVNIANSDMKSGLDSLLNTYVRMGGGLLTIGGSKTVKGDDGLDKQVADIYNHNEMYDNQGEPTLYQDMLPVECVEYTPSLALMLVIDVSGSMDRAAGGNQGTRLEAAKASAKECIDALNPRDYCAVIAFSDYALEVAPFTPASRKDEIKDKINAMKIQDATYYNMGIVMAGDTFRTMRDIDRKHIIFITDGEPSESKNDYPLFLEPIDRYYKDGITLSAIGISEDSSGAEDILTQMAKRGGGKAYTKIQMSELALTMRNDLKIDAITSYKPEKITPYIKDHTNVVKNVESFPELNGIYGTRAKPNVEVPLMGRPIIAEDELGPVYGVPVPLYAQWKLGSGRVGSFMCDLNGLASPDGWSELFWNDEGGGGIQIIKNIIAGLFPTQSLVPQEFEVEFAKPRNYKITTNIIAAVNETDTISITVTDPSGNQNAQPIAVTKSGKNFFKCVINVYQPGIYEIKIERKDSKGNLIKPFITHYAFSYSAEYNVFLDSVKDSPEMFLEKIASGGNGKVIPLSQPKLVFAHLKPTTEHTVDPRIAFISIAIALFLLDIAARKFKFKWPHEIMRDYKIKKKLKAGKK